MSRRFEDRTVIVTGAAGPIGGETARRFAAEGARVLGVDILQEPLDRVVAAIVASGGMAKGLALDLTAEGSPERVVETAESTWGPVHILAAVHGNVGRTLPGVRDSISRLTADNVSDAEWDRVMNNNLRSVFQTCRAVVPGMVQRGDGRIVTVSSIAMSGQPWMRGRIFSHYSSAKAGLAAFTRVLATEVAEKGVVVNCVAPGAIMSPEREESIRSEDPNSMEVRYRRIPRGRVGRPEDIAEAILFLSSDAADFIVGQTLHVNGGEWGP